MPSSEAQQASKKETTNKINKIKSSNLVSTRKLNFQTRKFRITNSLSRQIYHSVLLLNTTFLISAKHLELRIASDYGGNNNN